MTRDDRVRYKRGTRLVLGNALVARLLKTLLDRRPVQRSSPWPNGGALSPTKNARTSLED